MKHQIKTLVAALLIAIGFAACTDDSTSPVDDPSVLNLGAMKATVDGASFYSQTATALKNGELVTVTARQFVNGGQGSELINFVLVGADEGSNTGTGYFSYTPNINKPGEITTWSSNAISVEITSLTATEIQGRFSFTGDNEGQLKEVKNGVFRVKISN